jgi:hypothetical protein
MDSRLSRWSKKKLAHQNSNEAVVAEELADATDVLPADVLPADELAAEEVEAIDDSLSTEQHLQKIADSDSHQQLSGYLRTNCDNELKQAAMKKLFRASCFQLRDGLDDYDEDFSAMTKISPDFVAQMKSWVMNKSEELLSDAAPDQRQDIADGGAEDNKPDVHAVAQTDDNKKENSEHSDDESANS